MQASNGERALRTPTPADDRSIAPDPELAGLTRRADHLRVMASEATALLAHDLNNGLSVVKANLDYLSESLARQIAADPETQDATSSAQRALSRMVMLVRNFVDISRMEDAVMVANRTLVDIAAIVSGVAQIHLPRRSASRIELQLDVAPDLTARIDAMLFERVLHNLLGNATRYVNRGGIVRVAATVVDGVFVVAVGNSGPPIGAAMQATLFEKYATGSDGKAQTGMGLYFCRLAAEAHGGSIGLRRTTGLGVDIELRLPDAGPPRGAGTSPPRPVGWR